jgi:hypothetical protein
VVARGIRHYATRPKVAGLRPVERNESFRPHSEMSIRKRKIMFLESREQPELVADNLTAICEPDPQYLTSL